MRFSPDGLKILGLSKDERVSLFARIWNADNGKEVAALGPQHNFHHLAFVGRGDRVMTAGGSFIGFWDAVNGAPLVEIRVREGESGIVHAAVSPDGALVASGDAWIRPAAWDTRTGKRVTNLKEAREETFVHRFTPDGRYVVTTDDIGTIGFWDPSTGHLARTIQGPETGITSLDL